MEEQCVGEIVEAHRRRGVGSGRRCSVPCALTGTCADGTTACERKRHARRKRFAEREHDAECKLGAHSPHPGAGPERRLRGGRSWPRR